MSVAEILNEIDHLPPEAIPEVEAAIRRRRESLAKPDHEGVRPGFGEIAARVFDKHRDVMARLSQ